TDKTVTYTGENQTLEVVGTLPEGVSVNYTLNVEAFTGAVNAGTYEVVANFTGSNPNYNAIPSKTATLTIEKATYDLSGITFADKTVTYTGTNHTLEVVGTLPEGVSVSYTVNGEAFTGIVNAGTYEVVANFTSTNENYNAIPSKTATLTINKATFDVSEFDFEQHVVFDGKEHTYVISKDILDKLPEGVTASVVEKDAFVDCNEYLFTIKFSVEGNYNAIASVDATLFIDKADYDLSQFVLEDQSSHYTGKNLVASYSGKILDVNGEEVKVDVQFSYKQNGELVSPVNVGEYNVLAEFVVSDNNYNAIDNKLFTLTVLKGDIDWIELNDVMLQYTDDHKSISTKGDLPEGVSVNYFIDETPINDVTILEIGNHLITAKLVLSEEAAKSWNQPDDLKANLTITKKVIVPEFVCEYTYDGEPHNVVVQGIDGIFTASFENNDFVTEMVTKEVIVKFDGDFEHYSIGIDGVDETNSITVELVINQKTIEINDIAGLIDFMKNWKAKNTPSVKFVLSNDIDFNDSNKEKSVTYWESVGSWSSPFKSNFDGQGHTISNLLMTFESNSDDSGEKWIGFFGAIGQKGVVENLKIDHASIKLDASTSELVTETGILSGAIVGTAKNIEITNSTIDITTKKAEAGVLTGRLEGTIGGSYDQSGPKTTLENILIKDTSMTVKVSKERIAGGVISGRMYNSGITIKDVRMENVSLVADGNNISGASNLGVIVGYFKNSGATANIVNIDNVNADVKITTKSNTGVYVGGGAGYFQGPINFITTNYNVNLSVILNNPSSSYVGGFVGYSKGASLSKLVDSSLSTTITVLRDSEVHNDNFGKLMGYGSETEISSDTSNTTATLVFNCANESYSPTINEIGKDKLAA
ncbi:MAG: MBG domain-containing protein, partial [Bacilli bacterium]|nr:MBG domain-containing protein [Bacilli bacterium]